MGIAGNYKIFQGKAHQTIMADQKGFEVIWNFEPSFLTNVVFLSFFMKQQSCLLFKSIFVSDASFRQLPVPYIVIKTAVPNLYYSK